MATTWVISWPHYPRRVPSPASDPVDELLRPIDWLIGEWRGPGRGAWAGGFLFDDTMSFSHDGRPLLHYRQQTTGPDGRLSHSEVGYFVARPDGEIHVTLAEPSGITEVLVGHPIEGEALLELVTTEVGHTPTTDNVTACRRRFHLLDGDLIAEVDIAVNGEPLALHTQSTLHRIG